MPPSPRAQQRDQQVTDMPSKKEQALCATYRIFPVQAPPPLKAINWVLHGDWEKLPKWDGRALGCIKNWFAWTGAVFSGNTRVHYISHCAGRTFGPSGQPTSHLREADKFSPPPPSLFVSHIWLWARNPLGPSAWNTVGTQSMFF